MYKSISITCTNIPSANKKTNFLVDKKRIVMLKRNVEKIKKVYYTRHDELKKIDMNKDQFSQIYSWKLISELCYSIYTLQKEIYEFPEEDDL
jgi:hypothetical protein